MFKALKSFSGKISMVKGEVRDIADKEVVADLLRCNYIVDLTPTKKTPEKSKSKE